VRWCRLGCRVCAGGEGVENAVTGLDLCSPGSAPPPRPPPFPPGDGRYNPPVHRYSTGGASSVSPLRSTRHSGTGAASVRSRVSRSRSHRSRASTAHHAPAPVLAPATTAKISLRRLIRATRATAEELENPSLRDVAIRVGAPPPPPCTLPSFSHPSPFPPSPFRPPDSAPHGWYWCH
jgi:hypothetical protein